MIEAHAAPITQALRRHLGAVDTPTVRSFFAYLFERDALERFDRAKRPFRAHAASLHGSGAQRWRL